MFLPHNQKNRGRAALNTIDSRMSTLSETLQLQKYSRSSHNFTHAQRSPQQDLRLPAPPAGVVGWEAPPTRVLPPAAYKSRSAEPERPSAAKERACSVDPQVWFHSEAGRGPRSLPPRKGAGRSGHFIFLGSRFSFVSFAPSLRPSTSFGFGRGRECRSPWAGFGSGIG